MELIDIIRNRRSIRKYQDRRIERNKLDLIVEAGLFAPNPGGRQGAKIILLDDPKLIEEIGIVNANCENRNWNAGVSADQPSIIDDKTIKSGFYGCQALAMICVRKALQTRVNEIGSAFICAQNMSLEAYDQGISSVIVGRAEATFTQPGMQAYLDKWGLDPEYTPLVFLCLGYISGPYPSIKARNEGRVIYIGEEADGNP